MRKFSSYGPVDTRLHYYAPRQALIERAYTQMVGEDPTLGGHYITVWGPRQTARYAQQLGLREITLALFVEAVDDASRARYEVAYTDPNAAVVVNPAFVVTG